MSRRAPEVRPWWGCIAKNRTERRTRRERDLTIKRARRAPVTEEIPEDHAQVWEVWEVYDFSTGIRYYSLAGEPSGPGVSAYYVGTFTAHSSAVDAAQLHNNAAGFDWLIQSGDILHESFT